ncbi:MAG: hypothetical protein IJU95_07805, partial [Treponema sp.]|nr:hypothetical protein [Treponema sp.]
MKSCFFMAGLLLSALVLVGGAAAQVPNQSQQLRIQIWSELDPFPGSFGDEDWEAEVDEDESSPKSAANPTVQQESASADKSEAERREDTRVKLYSFAIGRAKELTPFFLSGMLSGWSFEYTPYDKGRGVEEFFEFGEINPFDWDMNSIE